MGSVLLLLERLLLSYFIYDSLFLLSCYFILNLLIYILFTQVFHLVLLLLTGGHLLRPGEYECVSPAAASQHPSSNNAFRIPPKPLLFIPNPVCRWGPTHDSSRHDLSDRGVHAASPSLALAPKPQLNPQLRWKLP